MHADGTSEELSHTGGVALGVMPGLEYAESSITLDAGDTLVLYTDGVSEAMNSEGEEFGMDRFREIFVDHPPNSARDTNEAILQAVHDFAGDTPQSDDVTCLVIQRVGG